MELPTLTSPETKFSSPQEELEYLRQRVAEKEQELGRAKEEFTREEVIRDEIKEYKEKAPQEVLAKGYAMLEPHKDAVILNLEPEPHDEKIGELLGILQEKGIMNTLHIVEKMGNPHIEDDFHRFLVEYVKEGFPVAGLKEKTPLSRAIRHTLYEISLPSATTEEKEKERQLKEVLSSMEQFYAGMLSVSSREGGEDFFTIELANSIGRQEFVFYASVPDGKRDLFEKQLLSIFPRAKIILMTNDYNIFNALGATAGSYGTLSRNPIYPVKTYDQFDYDPLNVILNTFSKLEEHGEGAAIQIVFSPAGDYYVARYREALKEVQKGVPLKRAIDVKHTVLGELFKVGKNAAVDVIKTGDKDFDKKEEVIDEKVVETIQNKIATPIIEANIRIVASGKTQFRAEEILSDIESAFNQFDNTIGNAVHFKRQKDRYLTQLIRDFSFRIFSKDEVMPLSLREATSLIHFPVSSVQSSAELRSAKAGTAPAPVGLTQEGILIGINRHRNIDTKIYMSAEDRLRHFYSVGQTGTGKTTFLKNMIIQDIKNGEGVCMIDPHGSDIQDVIANIPPERYEDLIYFDPSYIPRPMALNMLEYDPRYPEQKTFVVNEMLSIFNKLFDMKVAGGPMFEQYFRNATMLVIEDPETGNTLLDVSRVLAQKSFRELKLSRCKNPIVVQFWRDIAEKAGGESSLANIVPYITSKFDVFLSNEIMRPIIAQEKSSFNFREIMDEKKILLVNLAKGRLGDINSNLIGLILVGKILMAALSRVDSIGTALPPFYLYIDEFQNVTTDSISTILSEARKYKLSLTVAHQFIKQLDEKIRDSVFGNVGTIAAFRVGAEDAEFLEKQFKPEFTAYDLMNVDNHTAYLKMLSGGKPVKPFNVENIGFPPKGHPEITSKLKELSYLKFGQDRAIVEEKIMEKYKAAATKV